MSGRVGSPTWYVTATRSSSVGPTAPAVTGPSSAPLTTCRCEPGWAVRLSDSMTSGARRFHPSSSVFEKDRCRSGRSAMTVGSTAVPSRFATGGRSSRATTIKRSPGPHRAPDAGVSKARPSAARYPTAQASSYRDEISANVSPRASGAWTTWNSAPVRSRRSRNARTRPGCRAAWTSSRAAVDSTSRTKPRGPAASRAAVRNRSSRTAATTGGPAPAPSRARRANSTRTTSASSASSSPGSTRTQCAAAGVSSARAAGSIGAPVRQTTRTPRVTPSAAFRSEAITAESRSASTATAPAPCRPG